LGLGGIGDVGLEDALSMSEDIPIPPLGSVVLNPVPLPKEMPKNYWEIWVQLPPEVRARIGDTNSAEELLGWFDIINQQRELGSGR